jgi:hypothetical protein
MPYVRRVSSLTWCVVCVLVLAACDDGDGGDSGGGGHPTGSCEDAPCGGDPVGVWDLVTFCAGPETIDVAHQLTFGADGSYGYTSTASGNTYMGTWEIDDDGRLVTTVGGASGIADYCIGDDLFWWRSGTLTVVRSRAGSDADSSSPATR